MVVSLDDVLAVETAEREATQQYRAILRHALAHFSRRGYAGTNVRAIAADASLSAPMINYYFKTKQALHEAVVQIVMATLTDLVWKNFPRVASYEVQARWLIDRHAEFARVYPQALGLILGLVYGPPEGRPAVDLRELYGQTIRGEREIVEKAVEDGRLKLREDVTIDDAVRALEDAINRVTVRSWEAPGLASHLAEDTLKVMLYGISK